MSLFTVPTENADDKGYTFLDGTQSPSEFLDAFKEPVEHFDAPDPPPAPAIKEEETEKVTPLTAKEARFPAEFIVDVTDGAASFFASTLAADAGNAERGANNSQKEQLVNIWAKYLKGKGGDLPPGMMLLVMTAIVYVPIFKKAWDERAVNLENKKLKEEKAAQQAELEAQKLENQLLREQVVGKKLKEKQSDANHTEPNNTGDERNGKEHAGA